MNIRTLRTEISNLCHPPVEKVSPLERIIQYLSYAGRHVLAVLLAFALAPGGVSANGTTLTLFADVNQNGKVDSGEELIQNVAGPDSHARRWIQAKPNGINRIDYTLHTWNGNVLRTGDAVPNVGPCVDTNQSPKTCAQLRRTGFQSVGFKTGMEPANDDGDDPDVLEIAYSAVKVNLSVGTAPDPTLNLWGSAGVYRDGETFVVPPKMVLRDLQWPCYGNPHFQWRGGGPHRTCNFGGIPAGNHYVKFDPEATSTQYDQNCNERGWTDCDAAAPPVTRLLDNFLCYEVKTSKVCEGGVTTLTLLNTGPEAEITVENKNGLLYGPHVVFTEDNFVVAMGGEKIGSSITVFAKELDDDGSVISETETDIHTSCSQPIYPGQVFGMYEVVEGESLKGGPLATPAPKWEKRKIGLEDEYEDGIFKVEKPDKLCNPASKNGEEIYDPETHLMTYKIKLDKLVLDSDSDCGECKGGVTFLTLRYEGGTQAEITVTGKKQDDVLFGPTTVGSLEPFTVDPTDCDEKLGSEIKVYVNSELGAKIHTSCSKPIGVDRTYGGIVTVLDGASKDGGPLCPVPDCGKCKGGLTSLTLQYDGAETPATIEVTGKDPNYLLFGPESVVSGGQFTVIGTGKDGKLDKQITIYVDSVTAAEIHTSCSQPIGVGQVLGGDFTVVDGTSKDGGPLCPIIRINNQFGTLFVSREKSERLLVPSLKSLDNAIDDGEVDGGYPIDHFKCYKVKAPKDYPEIQATIVDQFDQPKLYAVEKPKMYCTPVVKYDGGDETQIKYSDDHLTCYKVKPVEGEPKHEEVYRIHVNNQFGPLMLDSKKEYELCVPSSEPM